MVRVKAQYFLRKAQYITVVLGIVIAQVGLFVVPAAHAQDSLELQRVSDLSLANPDNQGNVSFVGVSDDYRYVAYKIANTPGVPAYDIVKDSNDDSTHVANLLPDGTRIYTDFDHLSSDGQRFFFTNNNSLYVRDIATNSTSLLTSIERAEHYSQQVLWVSDDGSKMLVTVCRDYFGYSCTFSYKNVSDGSDVYAPPQDSYQDPSRSFNTIYLSNAYPEISNNGRYIVYSHNELRTAGNPQNGSHTSMIVYDVQTQTSRTIYDSANRHHIGSGLGSIYSISNDGRYIFTNVIDSDVPSNSPSGFGAKIIRYDQIDNAIAYVDIASNGANPTWQGPLSSGHGAISSQLITVSGDGQKAVFSTNSSDPLTPDTPGSDQNYSGTYVHDFVTGETRLISTSWQGNDLGMEIKSLGSDGSRIYYRGQADGVDGVYQSAGPSSYVDSRDRVSPVISSVSWSANPRTVHTIEGSGGYFSFDASDDRTGIVYIEAKVDNSLLDNGHYFQLGSSVGYNVGDGWSVGDHEMSFRVQDGAGNWSDWFSSTFTVIPDPPTMNEVAWTNNPKGLSQVATVTVPVSDDYYGVAGGEYYIGDTDPGEGNGVPMSFDGNNLSASFDSSLAPGVYEVHIRVKSNSGAWSETRSSSLYVADPAAITSANLTSVGMRTPFDFKVTTTGSFTSALYESAGGLPPGVTFTDNGDGTADIAGSAAAGSAGDYQFTITASDGVSPPVEQAFTLTITSATSPPSFSSPSSDTETFGVPFSYTVTTTGYPAPKLTKTGGLPAGVTFVDNNDGTATISGTPAQSAVGVYNLNIKAKSTAGTATQAFALTITKSPVITKIPNKTAKAGTAFSMAIKASGYNTPSLTESGTLPAGLTFVDNGNGTAGIAGTPAAGSGASYPVTITAANSLGSSSQTFTIKINESPMITSAETATATTGSPFSFQVTDTGFPNPTVSKTGTLPKGVTWSGATHTFSGTPKAGSAGTYPITITVKNSSGTVTQNFVLVVNDPMTF